MDWWERKDRIVSLTPDDVRILDTVLKEVRCEFAFRLSLPDPPMTLLSPDSFYDEVLRRYNEKKSADG